MDGVSVAAAHPPAVAGARAISRPAIEVSEILNSRLNSDPVYGAVLAPVTVESGIAEIAAFGERSAIVAGGVGKGDDVRVVLSELGKSLFNGSLYYNAAGIRSWKLPFQLLYAVGCKGVSPQVSRGAADGSGSRDLENASQFILIIICKEAISHLDKEKRRDERFEKHFGRCCV